MFRIPAYSALWQALIATAAMACDCGLPVQKDLAAATILSRSRLVVYGSVTSISEMGSGTRDPIVRARISVAKVIKGTAPHRITVLTVGGDNGANCGLANVLRLAMQDRRTISLVPKKMPSFMAPKESPAFARHPYWVDLCTSGWDFESVVRNQR